MQDQRGRQFIAFHEVRGSIFTAAATLTNGTATSLIPGDVDYFADIIEVSFANNSSGAARVSLINDGTIVKDLASGPGGNIHQFNVPVAQPVKNTPWNVQMEDITNTTVVFNTRFIKRTQE